LMQRYATLFNQRVFALLDAVQFSSNKVFGTSRTILHFK
jgi:hypothetical protein